MRSWMLLLAAGCTTGCYVSPRDSTIVVPPSTAASTSGSGSGSAIGSTSGATGTSGGAAGSTGGGCAPFAGLVDAGQPACAAGAGCPQILVADGPYAYPNNIVVDSRHVAWLVDVG